MSPPCQLPPSTFYNQQPSSTAAAAASRRIKMLQLPEVSKVKSAVAAQEKIASKRVCVCAAGEE